MTTATKKRKAPVTLHPVKTNLMVVKEALEAYGDYISPVDLSALVTPEGQEPADKTVICNTIYQLKHRGHNIAIRNPSSKAVQYKLIIDSREEQSTPRAKEQAPVQTSKAPTSQNVQLAYYFIMSYGGRQVDPDMLADHFNLDDEQALVLFNKVVQQYGDQLRVHRTVCAK